MPRVVAEEWPAADGRFGPLINRMLGPDGDARSLAWRSGAQPGPLELAVGGLMLLCAALILYSLWFLLAATSIWFVKTWNATEVLRAVLAAGRYPVSAYPPGMRTFFTLVVPITFLTTVPAEALLGRSSVTWLVLSLVVAAVCLLLARSFWRFALRFYTSASS